MPAPSYPDDAWPHAIRGEHLVYSLNGRLPGQEYPEGDVARIYMAGRLLVVGR